MTALAVSLVDKKGRVQHRIARIWARGAVRISLSKLKVEGAGKPAEAPGGGVCPEPHVVHGHAGHFCGTALSVPHSGEKAIVAVAVYRLVSERSGQMPIDTGNPHATLSSLGGAVKALRKRHAAVGVSGGRADCDGELQPFLSGAAYLAIRAQVPLVPIALKGVYDLLPIHTHHFYPGELTLRVGEPIETKGMTVRQNGELTERLREAIEEMLGEPAGVEAEAPVS